MSFSSRRRNYLLTPHRRDGLIEWMKSMLQHSFVLDALETTGADTFEHFEVLVDEHREMEGKAQPSRLQQLVPTIGIFHTPLPLRAAFQIYNDKHRLTKRKHIQISFNEIRHILNLAQIMAMRKDVPGVTKAAYALLSKSSQDIPPSCPTHAGGGPKEKREEKDDEDDDASSMGPLDYFVTEADNGAQEDTNNQLNGPKLISFDGDQTLYSDGENFEENPRLARYMELLLKHGVSVAIVTAAGYEYHVEKYDLRLSGLLRYFEKQRLTAEECGRFYLFGGECNYLMKLGADFHLHPIKERGPGGWITATSFLPDSPGNWQEDKISALLDIVEAKALKKVDELCLRGRVIRKKRAVGLVPSKPGAVLTRESLDEVVLSFQEELHHMNHGAGPGLPYCAFNGGSDAWVDVGNKRVGVQILQSYLGISPAETLHIGDQFLNTGNDYAARAVSPCIWIINPTETTYILKSILRLSGINFQLPETIAVPNQTAANGSEQQGDGFRCAESVNFEEMQRRTEAAKMMDVYTGELVGR